MEVEDQAIAVRIQSEGAEMTTIVAFYLGGIIATFCVDSFYEEDWLINTARALVWPFAIIQSFYQRVR